MTGGEDYEEIRNKVLIFDNDTSVQHVVVTIFEDNIEEDEEEFSVILTESSGTRIVKRFDIELKTAFGSITINSKQCFIQRFVGAEIYSPLPILFLFFNKQASVFQVVRISCFGLVTGGEGIPAVKQPQA